MEGQAEKTRFTFAVERIQEKELLGTLSLFNCNWVDRSVGLGIDIHSPEAVRLLLDFAFKTLNLNRVELEVFDFNERALRCYRKVGFRKVGKKMQARLVDGKYRDVIVMDVLRSEWK